MSRSLNHSLKFVPYILHSKTVFRFLLECIWVFYYCFLVFAFALFLYFVDRFIIIISSLHGSYVEVRVSPFFSQQVIICLVVGDAILNSSHRLVIILFSKRVTSFTKLLINSSDVFPFFLLFCSLSLLSPFTFASCVVYS